MCFFFKLTTDHFPLNPWLNLYILSTEGVCKAGVDCKPRHIVRNYWHNIFALRGLGTMIRNQVCVYMYWRFYDNFLPLTCSFTLPSTLSSLKWVNCAFGTTSCM